MQNRNTIITHKKKSRPKDHFKVGSRGEVGGVEIRRANLNTYVKFHETMPKGS